MKTTLEQFLRGKVITYWNTDFTRMLEARYSKRPLPHITIKEEGKTLQQPIMLELAATNFYVGIVHCNALIK